MRLAPLFERELDPLAGQPPVACEVVEPPELSGEHCRVGIGLVSGQRQEPVAGLDPAELRALMSHKSDMADTSDKVQGDVGRETL